MSEAEFKKELEKILGKTITWLERERVKDLLKKKTGNRHFDNSL